MKPINVLAVICTFNPKDKRYDESFKNFTHTWFNTIRSWQMQRNKNVCVDIVVADNVSGPKTRAALVNFQKRDKVFNIDFIDQRFSSPLLCFNHAVSVFKNKKYDYYAYCASDASFCNENDLKVLLSEIEADKNCAFISPQADSDMSQRFNYDVKKSPTKLNLGEGVNNHLSLYRKNFMRYYDYKLVDVIGGPRSESFYTFLCAAVKSHELLSHRVRIHHLGAHDRRYAQPLLTLAYQRDFYKMLREGQKIGLGFEECLASIRHYNALFLNSPTLRHFLELVLKHVALNPQLKKLFDGLAEKKLVPASIVKIVRKIQGNKYCRSHKADCFDTQGYAKTNDLYKFIKKNLFLTKEELNYKKIPHTALRI